MAPQWIRSTVPKLCDCRSQERPCRADPLAGQGYSVLDGSECVAEITSQPRHSLQSSLPLGV